MKILMVCLGNICRSPLAEGILKHKITTRKLNWTVESAGTNGFHIGENPHRSSCKVAKENGIDISAQIARQFTKDDFGRYDKIYALAGDVITEMKAIAGNTFDPSKVDLLMNEMKPLQNLDVPDPWYGDESGYYPVFKMIDEACEALIQNNSKILQHD